MGCCGLFKSKKSKKSKNSQVQTQGFAARPIQPVVQNGKYSYQPAKDSHQQFNPQNDNHRAANRAVVGAAVHMITPHVDAKTGRLLEKGGLAALDKWEEKQRKQEGQQMQGGGMQRY